MLRAVLVRPQSSVLLMDAISELIEAYGKEAKAALNGPGEPEAALAQPVTGLLKGYGSKVLGVDTVLHEEVREDAGAVRPDYGVKINQLMTGHVELKRPGASLDPATYGKASHNGRQWQRLRNLPNLLHTNGSEWRLWRYGELVGGPVYLHTAGLADHKGPLLAPNSFSALLNDFLTWEPTPITSVSRLVNTIAPLAAMLREEVLESLKADRRYAKSHGIDENLRPFVGLRRDWRASLYPRATDEEFADGFAQTVVFSLVIGLSENMDFTGMKIPEIAQKLQARHTLLGRALDLLTEHIGNSTVGTATETIVRALSAADWGRISGGRQDVYLHLYEHFLSGYNPERRKQSGSYYTPIEVVEAMTRLTDSALRTHLHTPEGLAADSVAVIDPAMGTGTYPLAVLRQVATHAEPYGAGAVADAVSSAAGRIYGIELQSGPFSVAELRLTQAIRDMGGTLPEQGLNLYVADTLEDPKSGSSRQLSYTLQLIAQQRQQANQVKLETPIQVCIGNPPYKDKAQGMGGWVENGEPLASRALLDDFRLEGNGRLEYVLKNLYVYFWRWAMWKVFESTIESTHGVVCFITATGYLNGPGFQGMREWIRRNTSRGWIINLTPEGKQPPADTAVFNIETEVAIAVFIRDGVNDGSVPSDIQYTELHGKRHEKFENLSALQLDDAAFREVGTDWVAPFSPKASDDWTSYPAMNDLYPWTAPGIKPNKTWVYNPSPDILEERWSNLLRETDVAEKRQKFKETRDTTLEKVKTPLAGTDTEQGTRTPLANVAWPYDPAVVPVGFRSFDRQHILADSRLIHMPSPPLWAARSETQVFITEQHAHYPKPGPGLSFTSLIPDMHHFNNRGGRALPMFHPDGTPNVASHLLEALSRELGLSINVDELTAYVAGVSAHPDYVKTFDEELHYDGNRVPLTADPGLWVQAVELGQHVIWLHTFGERGKPPAGLSDVMDPTTDLELPEYSSSVGSDMPEKVAYNSDSRTLHLGKGTWSNVDPRVWDYTVGGNRIIESWVGYRRKKPKGRKSSPLDEIITTSWPTEWSRELHRLLTVLTRLIHLEDDQAQLMQQVIRSPTLTRSRLAAAGVKWPSTAKDRKPRFISDNTLL